MVVLAAKRSIAKSTVDVASVMKAVDAPRDLETKVDLGPKVARIRDSQFFGTTGLTARMEETWGTFTAITTGTDVEKSLVYIYKAGPLDSPVVPVNRYGTMNAVTFSFSVPLKKLDLEIASDRQLEVKPYEQPLDDGSTAFVLPMAKKVSLPRNRKKEASEVAGTKVTEALLAADPQLAAAITRLQQRIEADQATIQALLGKQVKPELAEEFAKGFVAELAGEAES